MLVGATLFVVGPLAPAPPAEAAASDTTLVSAVAGTTDVGGDAASQDSNISPDGRYVAFDSAARNLTGSEESGSLDYDVFVRDTLTRQVYAATDLNCNPIGNICQALYPSISDDGRFVAFTATDKNLVTPDTNGSDWDVYVRDLATGQIIRASVDSLGAQVNILGAASISGNGEWVIFSTTDSLTVTDTNGGLDVYAQHLHLPTPGDPTFTTGVTILVSAVDGSDPPASGSPAGSYLYVPGATDVASFDGRYVVFSSDSSNLVSPGTGSTPHIYRRDLVTNSTVLVDDDAIGGRGNNGALGASVSANGQVVAFASQASNFATTPECYLNGNHCFEIFVRDLGASTADVKLVSLNVNGQASNADIVTSSVSGDGRYILFDGPDAAQIVSGDTNGAPDVFVRDMATSDSTRISVHSNGSQLATGGSLGTMGSDYRFTAFRSSTADIVPGVSGQQIYRRFSSDFGIAGEQNLGACAIYHASRTCALQAEPINTATGSYFTQTNDLRLPGIGIPFAFTRSYNSADGRSSVMGPGWTHSYEIGIDFAWNGDAIVHTEDGQRLRYNVQGTSVLPLGTGLYDVLVHETDGTYSLTRKDQVTYRFDATGLLTSIRDRNDEGLTFTNTAGKLAIITDSVGRLVSFQYTDGLLTRVALPDGRDVEYGYTSGRLTSVIDARGGTTTYDYDAGGRLRTITDQNDDTIVTNVYGTDGRIVEQTDGRNNTSTFDWDPLTQTSTFTDARGRLWQDVYHNGVLVERVNPLSQAIEYAYDDALNLTSITDPRGFVTTFTYDAAGNVLTKTDPAPLNYLTTYTYNARNDIATVTDPRTNTTTYGYDAAGNLTSITQPGSIVTTFGRDPSGNGLLTSVTDPRNKTTTYGYDTSGNLTSITDPLGKVTTMGYDGSGRMTSRVDPRGNEVGQNPADYTWTFTYDDADHLLTQTDPLVHTTTYVFDPTGNLTSRTDAKNHTVAWGYDENRNLETVTAPGSIVTTYGYDPNNNLTSRLDANSHTWTYAYDDANRLASVTSPLSKVWSFGYDASGNLTTKTLPSGSITYGYDPIDRLSSIAYSDAPTTPNVTFGYDGNSNRTSMTDGQGSVTYTYDALNRLTQATRGTNTFTWGYDAASNLTTRTYPGSVTTTYTYDDANRLATTVANSATTSYAYDAAGNPLTETLPASTGFTSTMTYDRAGRLTEVKNQKTGQSPLSRFTYTLDDVGNPTQVVTPTETITYAYDALDRLTQVCFKPNCTGSGLAGYDYTYDGVGNRLTQVRRSTSNTTTTYTYNADDQLTAAGSTSYTWSTNGNQASAGTRTFTYDLENRLRTTTSGSTTHTYSYDADGNRAKDSWGTTASTNVNYLWDVNAGLPLLAIERNGNNALLRRYTYGTDLLAESTSASNAFYYLGHPLGSTANLVNSSGTTLWTYTYEPYGATRSAVNGGGAPTNLMRFTGQLIDTVDNLYDLRARMYDPSTGRFLEQDPESADIMAPSLSTFAYAVDRPTALVDPSGASAEGPCGGASCWAVLSDMVSHPVGSLDAGWDSREGCPWPSGIPWIGDEYCEGFLGLSPDMQGLFAAGANALPPALGVALAWEACVIAWSTCARLAVKIEIHGPHHYFPTLGGRYSHLQLNWWIRGGPKGNGGGVRLPIPWKRG